MHKSTHAFFTRPNLAAAATTAVLACAAPALQAATVTVQFEGLVSVLLNNDASGVFGNNFQVADTISGQFSFDTADAGRFLQPTDLQDYNASFQFNLAGRVFNGQAYYRLFNRAAAAGGDGWALTTDGSPWAGPVLGNLAPTNFFIQFLGMPETTLDNTLMLPNPQDLVNLADLGYAPHGMRMDDTVDASWGGLYFTLNRVQVVPEPGGLLLVGTALALAAAARRRRG